MHQFVKNLRAAWRRLDLPIKDRTIVAAISGGADSTALVVALHNLKMRRKLDLEIVVAHFNHCLRSDESDADARFVESLAAQLELKFVCGNSNRVSQTSNVKDNLEQAARCERYDFLFKTAVEHRAFAVLTAHTLDDQAETFLLRLLRGSAADGLGAMRAISANYELPITNYDKQNLKPKAEQSKIHNPKSTIHLVRPLLGWARRVDTENFCRALHADFRVDSMNDDERFARVRVRKRLIPFLETFNPKIVETLANTADLLREDAEELNRQAENWLRERDFRLPASDAALLAGSLRRRVVRLWLKLKRGDLRQITTVHLRAIESLIVVNRGDRTIELPGGAFVVRRQNQLVYLPQVEKSDGQN